MKKSFEKVINNFSSDEKKLLFGEDCRIVVNNLKYSTNTKKFVLDCSLLVKDINPVIESYPAGIYYLASESWKIMGFQQDLDIITSLDLLD